MLKRINLFIVGSFLGLISPYVLAQDFCQIAHEKIYEQGSDLLAVVKVNTSKPALYQSIVEISKNCQSYSPFLSVKDPDVIKTTNGFCMVLPASEIQPNVCGMRVTLCNSEKNCQTVTIRLKMEAGHYVSAEPGYYEMTFSD
ncbi:hypothetical protein [Legionella cardiaca]|uniref:Uncharacterized protein n=1 Tax=Legionella cardiaca TaxID=1071983 RepID=A0ABY8AM95_9GAMM|nr:hypothetical protein [Legionella cardiaca]WED41824.1 hypothetical protein PXX05_07720 [Legionella cardiaca]